MSNQELLSEIRNIIKEELKPIKGDINRIENKVEAICEMLEEDIARIEDESLENYKSISRLRSTLKRKSVI